jgi:hypothetical protein
MNLHARIRDRVNESHNKSIHKIAKGREDIEEREEIK